MMNCLLMPAMHLDGSTKVDDHYSEINLEGALADVLDTNDLFNEFVQQTLESFGLGIKKLVTIKKPVEEFFGEDNKTDMEALLTKLQNHLMQ